jgi:hypothetical protein
MNNQNNNHQQHLELTNEKHSTVKKRVIFDKETKMTEKKINLNMNSIDKKLEKRFPSLAKNNGERRSVVPTSNG